MVLGEKHGTNYLPCTSGPHHLAGNTAPLRGKEYQPHLLPSVWKAMYTDM